VLRLLQQQLEAIYRVTAPDVTDFVVDDDQLAEVLGDDRRPADEWVLVREADDGLELAVWIDQNHLDALNAAGTPGRALDGCFTAMCAAVEGVSHFLMLVDRARRQEPVRLLELEAQAEVDKFVCARLHRPRRAAEWHARLFRDARLQPNLSPDERYRYQRAGRLAAGLCTDLDRHPHTCALLDDLRRFWRASGDRRLERMRTLAA
jgi:hypothetical protein